MSDEKTKTSTIKTWQLYLGIALIVVQFIGFGFIFMQDRNNAFNRITMLEVTNTEMGRNLKDLTEAVNQLRITVAVLNNKLYGSK